MGIARLSTFIRQNKSPILSEWEAFARSLEGSLINIPAGLREHASIMLDAIADDIESPQSAAEQSDKSKGLQQETRRRGHAATAATDYGGGLVGSGFSILDVMAEFRVLRASVTRLWITQTSQFGREELEALIRFDEAIDEAIAYSLERYVRDIGETQDEFLSILCCDLRNRLTAVGGAASLLAEAGELAQDHARLVATIQSAAVRMAELVTEMLELAGGLNNGAPTDWSEIDAGGLVEAAVAAEQSSYPAAKFEISTEGNLAGRGDGARLGQALTSVIGNAIQHGDGKEPIRISVRGTKEEISIIVRNSGPPIPPDRLPHIFEGPQAVRALNGDARHLGLGLFIVNKIVAGHGGSVEVRSAGNETAVTIHLPRVSQGAIVRQQPPRRRLRRLRSRV